MILKPVLAKIIYSYSFEIFCLRKIFFRKAKYGGIELAFELNISFYANLRESHNFVVWEMQLINLKPTIYPIYNN